MAEHIAVSVQPELPSLAIAMDAEDQTGGGRRSPSLGLRLGFQGLTYTVKDRKDKKKEVKLLDGITAYAEPFQLTVLIGPSGSGKTTLLDVLAGRKTAGAVTGEVRFGHTKPSSAFLRRHTAYVEQFDTLIPSLTVTEMLMYTAELKRSLSEPRSSKQELVRQLQDRLGLNACADVVIGDQLTTGVSGGEAKRTNIGIALISNPRVLFLDEPTSGLDSYTANKVVELMHSLSRDGTTVVATIHSPTATAFSLFDVVLMLVKGRTVYFGPREMSMVFAQQHWSKCVGVCLGDAGSTSLAEFLVDTITDADRAGKGAELAAAYQASDLCRDNAVRVATSMIALANPSLGRHKKAAAATASATSSPVLSPTSSADQPLELRRSVDGPGERSSTATTVTHASNAHDGGPRLAATVSSAVGNLKPVRWVKQLSRGREAEETLDEQLATQFATATPWWWGLMILIRYRSSVNYRTAAWLIPRFADKVFYALIIVALYFRKGGDYSLIVNMTASLFLWCTLPAFGAACYMPSIVLERKLFYRERADGLYHVGTYLLAKVLEEMVLAAAISTALSAAVFYGVNYQGSFALFQLVYLLTLGVGIMLSYFLAALAPSMEVASVTMAMYVTALLFLGGHLAIDIPVYLGWFSKINFVRCAWYAVMANQFSEFNPPFTPEGVTVLDYYSITPGAQWNYFALLFAFFGAFSTLAYLALSFVRHGAR